MIKVYCDECGKEITGNINKEIEETKAIDLYGEVAAKWTKTLHYCDECQYKDLTCGFKVGDQVITDNGRVGVIEGICDCEYCKDRGFYEPKVKMTIGNDQIWISDTDKKNGFISFYKIGDQVFGNVNKEAIEDIRESIANVRHELVEYESQLNVLLDLTSNQRK
jgi:hypothetical protein